MKNINLILSKYRSFFFKENGSPVTLIGIILLVLFSANSHLYGQSESLRQYQLKAAFIFNFIKFAEWPEEALGDSALPIIIGVLGDNPFGDSFGIIENKSAKGRELFIKQFKTVQEVDTCHILFISSSEQKKYKQIFDVLKSSSILTVGETDDFTQQGGIISLIVNKNRIRFEINLDAVEDSEIRLSSQLLKLAMVVRNE